MNMTNDTTTSINRDIFSVSELNRRARFLLETHLPLIWVEGELSNVSIPSSGHWYFTLKDENAQVRCAMFRNRNMGITFRPEHGQKVLLRARVSLYEGRGDYQIIAEHMELSGTGALQRAFEQLKQRLFAEGLFAPERKKAIPRIPTHIGLITSPTGAAVHDIISALERRYPNVKATLIPVAVQGKEAAPQICAALKLANDLKMFDVIILGRGGGSLEDLWPFNEESVARAIASSSTPIVSAVGHEVDFTIADFVADLRAPTPTAAAEMVTPNGDELLEQFCSLEITLEKIILNKINSLKNKVNLFYHKIEHPKQKLEQQSQRLDLLENRLLNATKTTLANAKKSWLASYNQLAAQHPKYQLANLKTRLQNINQRWPALASQLTISRKIRLQNTSRMLNTLNPLNTLERGYSLASLKDGQVITSSDQISVGEIIQLRLAKGSATTQIIAVSNNQDLN